MRLPGPRRHPPVPAGRPPEELPERLAAAVHDRLALRQTTGALAGYALATVTHDALSVHRLVQAVVRQRLDDQTRQAWAASGTRLLLAALPGEPEDVATWPVAARLLPHALAVTNQPDSQAAEPAMTALLLIQAARYLWGRAEHAQAKDLNERALAICEATLPADHPMTAFSLSSLAAVLHAQGDLDAARNLHERALAIYEARLGADHPATANSLDNLAAVLAAQGDLDAARALLERALAIYEARLGADHPATVRSRQALAMVVTALDKQ